MPTIDPDTLDQHPRPSIGPAPLLPAAAGLVAGIVMDNAWGPNTPLAVALVVAAALFSLFAIRHSLFRLAPLLAAVGLGALLHDGSYRRVPADSIARYIADRPAIIRVTGTVASDPRPRTPPSHFFARWTRSPPATRFFLSAQTIEGRTGSIPVRGTISVRVDGDLTGVNAGDAVTIHGLVNRPAPPGNPGQFDYATWQRWRGIHAQMRCKSQDLVLVVESNAAPWRAMLTAFRTGARSLLIGDDIDADANTAALLETLVLGRRSAVNRRTEELFIRTGIAHYLAVSGAHLGVVAGLAWAIGRWLGATRRRSAWVVAVVIVSFTLLVDPRPPVFRAAVIGLAFCAAAILRRSTSAINTLSLALIILCARPTTLFQPGFQMSFACATAIVLFYAPILHFLLWPIQREQRRWGRLAPAPPTPTLPRRFLRRAYVAACGVTAVSIAAFIAAAPIAMIHFDRFAPLGWFHSIILFPLFTATLISGVIALAAGALTPALLPATRWAANLSAETLLKSVEWIQNVSPEFHGSAATLIHAVYIGVFIALLGSLCIGSTTLAERFPKRSGVSPWWASCAAAIIFVVATAALRGAPSHTDSLRITHLAVGRGTAAVIELPDGKVWLYDCGTNWNFDVGRSVIAPFCRWRGIDRIDRVLITHPNMDHFNGLFSVLDAIPTGPVLLNRHFNRFATPGGPAHAMTTELLRREHPVGFVAPGEFPTAPPGVIARPGVSAEIIWPGDSIDAPSNPNDTSTVLRLDFAGRSILLCGDIERDAMTALLKRGDLRADVLILPHHGSIERNTAAFIAAVDPAVCIRSSHQRTADASAALAAALADRILFNTADEGAVTCEIDATGTVRVAGFHGRRTELPRLNPREE